MTLAAQFVLGRYTGYRLAELYRFGDLLAEEAHGTRDEQRGTRDEERGTGDEGRDKAIPKVFRGGTDDAPSAQSQSERSSS